MVLATSRRIRKKVTFAWIYIYVVTGSLISQDESKNDFLSLMSCLFFLGRRRRGLRRSHTRSWLDDPWYPFNEGVQFLFLSSFLPTFSLCRKVSTSINVTFRTIQKYSSKTRQACILFLFFLGDLYLLFSILFSRKKK